MSRAQLLCKKSYENFKLFHYTNKRRSLSLIAIYFIIFIHAWNLKQCTHMTVIVFIMLDDVLGSNCEKKVKSGVWIVLDEWFHSSWPSDNPFFCVVPNFRFKIYKVNVSITLLTHKVCRKARCNNAKWIFLIEDDLNNS